MTKDELLETLKQIVLDQAGYSCPIRYGLADWRPLDDQCKGFNNCRKCWQAAIEQVEEGDNEC
jgi:Sec7-like guanine-nucleotide exchange factor